MSFKHDFGPFSFCVAGALIVIACATSELRAAVYVVQPDVSFSWPSMAANTNVGDLGNQFDCVLFKAAPQAAPYLDGIISTLALAVTPGGPGNYRILSGATYLSDGGIAPNAIQLNVAPEPWGTGPYDFFSATFSFDSQPVSLGHTTTTLVLEFPLGALDPADNNLMFCWINIDEGFTTAEGVTSCPLTPAPEPATLSLLALGGLAILHRRKK
jgi:hypothetical protein